MFREWGFLVTEMVMLEILAAVLGLITGWVIWGGKRRSEQDELEACQAVSKEKDARIADLAGQLEAARAEAQAAEKAAMLAAEEAAPVAEAAHAEDEEKLATLQHELEAARAEAQAAEKAAMLAAAEAPAVAEAVEADHGRHSGDPGASTRPARLDAPRSGKPDDLKLIKGIGPKLETLCHDLGFFHFDQIAGWGSAEVSWVDENLPGFRGRVSRDGWVEQARVLASGGTTKSLKR